jgi:hypothetical protein
MFHKFSPRDDQDNIGKVQRINILENYMRKSFKSKMGIQAKGSPVFLENRPLWRSGTHFLRGYFVQALFPFRLTFMGMTTHV